MPSVLLTGAARGIGRATLERLLAEDFEVWAGVRRPEDGEALAALSPRVHPLIIDVGDSESIAAAVAGLPERLDGLVNNAGIVVPGPVEGLALDDLRRQLEVNVVGQVAVTQAVLPRLRAARGRIVFISSISGRVTSPMTGAYSASKYALESLADALRLELRPWGIAVALVEPGAIDTDLWRKAPESAQEAEAALAPEHRRLYEAHLSGMRKLIPRMQKGSIPAAKVADVVLGALTASRPRSRYLVGTDARVQLALRRALPGRAADTVMARVAGVPRRA